jgi:hypothetical protein
MRTAGVVGLGLAVWLLVPIVASYFGPFAVPLVLPLLALRGAVAPSWIARAGVTARSGVRGFLDAVTDHEGRRVHGVLVELLCLVGSIGLALNLWITLSALLVLGRSMLGIDLALLDTFLSSRNVFVLLAVGAAALVLLEPLRVALSATYFVDAQIRREGLDLYAAIDQAERAAAARSYGSAERPAPASRGPAAAAMLLFFAGAALSPAVVEAQEPPITEAGQREASAEPDLSPEAFTRSDDEAARAEARRILAAPEYREFAESRGRGLRTLVERILAYLFRPRELPDMELGGFAIPMPPVWAFVAFGAALLAIVIVALVLTRTRKERVARAKDDGAESSPEDPRDRPPEAHLDDAAMLARDGRYREALRSLYLATLVSLDRKREITFDPTRTNWHYLREMPRGERRDDFGTFTRLFDYKWYGDEETDEHDYAACRALADRICLDEAAR